MFRSCPFKTKPAMESGFTILELAAVLTLLGILAAFIAVRASDRQTDLVAHSEKLKSQLRYAQMQSMSSDAVWGVHAEGNQYWLFTGGDTDQRRMFPGEEELVVDMAAHGLNVTDFTYSFETWGAPCTDTAAASRLTAAASILISDGENSRPINITPFTGFMP